MYVLSDNNIIHHKIDRSIVIIGNFDGIHLGHMKLLDQAKIIADKYKLPILMMCFDPHPVEFFSENNKFRYILPLKDKIQILKKYSIDYLFIKKITDLSIGEPLAFLTFQVTNITKRITELEYHDGP